jgi:hypothetical protein
MPPTPIVWFGGKRWLTCALLAKCALGGVGCFSAGVKRVEVAALEAVAVTSQGRISTGTSGRPSRRR